MPCSTAGRSNSSTSTTAVPAHASTTSLSPSGRCVTARTTPTFRDALLTGYRTRRDLDMTDLDHFIAARQVAFDLWYTGTAQVNTVFAGRLDNVHLGSMAMLDLLEAS